MRSARTATFVVGTAVMAVVAAVAGSRVAANGTIDPEVLAARETAWRTFFGGDTKGLGELLPPEFIGVNMNGGPFTDRAATLENARAFRERGGKLLRLTFPDTQAQRFGDVVVLYGRYEVVVESGGAERTMRGRLTEVFVRRDGKWVHPGWHLDLAEGPSPAQP